MHSEIEVRRLDSGYVVCVMSENEEDRYNAEEYALEDPLDVLAEVLRWLGYDEDTRDGVIDMLDEDVAYELTDKGRETLARLERERAEQAWEAQRVAAMKRGVGRGGYWTGTATEYTGR